MGKSYVVLAVFTNPLLISIYNIDDFYKKVSEGDLIVYENGQQVKERLLKETSKPLGFHLSPTRMVLSALL